MWDCCDVTGVVIDHFYRQLDCASVRKLNHLRMYWGAVARLTINANDNICQAFKLLLLAGTGLSAPQFGPIGPAHGRGPLHHAPLHHDPYVKVPPRPFAYEYGVQVFNTVINHVQMSVLNTIYQPGCLLWGRFCQEGDPGWIRSGDWRVQSGSARRQDSDCHLQSRPWRRIHCWCQIRGGCCLPWASPRPWTLCPRSPRSPGPQTSSSCWPGTTLWLRLTSIMDNTTSSDTD